MILDGQWQILGPALAAGLLVLASHVPLGQVVLKRGIIFIDLAIAQIAGLGVILAYGLGWHDHGWEAQLAAVTAALLGADLICSAEKYCRDEQEALIGVGFVLAATASILLLADNPQGGEHLRELLVGQILWVSWSQLGVVAAITLAFLVLWFSQRQMFNGIGFYLLFAVAITASVQLVGVYLVFASLIIPALAVSRFSSTVSMWLGYGVGILGYLLGLMASTIWDLPSGATITWSLALVALVCRLVCKPASR